MSERALHAVAVIGGGQAAKAVLFAVAEGAAAGTLDWRGCRIEVFERGDEFATGLAWSRRYALEDHYSSLASAQTRVAYGDDQIRQLHACVEMLAAFGVAATLHGGCAIERLDARDGRWRLEAAAGRAFTADSAILATGHWSGDPVTPGAVRPWPAGALQQAFLAAPGGAVSIVGSRLTAVDAAISLATAAGDFVESAAGALAYRPNRPLALTMCSRSGCLPGVWGPWPNKRPGTERAVRAGLEALIARHGRLGLADALDVVAATAVAEGIARAEGWAAPGAPVADRLEALARSEAVRAANPLATLAAELRQVIGGRAPAAIESLEPVPHQAFLLAILPTLSELYPALDAEDHALFERSLRGALYRAVMPMTLPVALRIAALGEAGALALCKLAPGEELLPADLLVDATGQNATVTKSPDPLMRHLLAAQIVGPSRRPSRAGDEVCGGGLGVDPATRRVSSAEQEPALYAMGTLTMGAFLDAQSIGHLMRDAAALVRDIDRRLRGVGRNRSRVRAGETLP